ncbi:MAG: hypothetical protein V9G98_22550 [Candidatus Competibacter sp.]
MDITITMTAEELHDLSNRVQLQLWKTELKGEPVDIWQVLGRRVLAAAEASLPLRPRALVGPGALEYAGKYFAMKSRAEHLEVQNVLLMKAVEQMAARGSQMQSALIEAGLVSKIPPPARLLESEWSQSPVVTS